MAETNTPAGKIKVYRHNQTKKTGSGAQAFNDKEGMGPKPIRPKFNTDPGKPQGGNNSDNK